MAAQRTLFPAILYFILIFCHAKAAIVPHQASPAAHHHHHGAAAAVVGGGPAAQQEVMSPHELDLADLSLPPEVITEALFSQTDLLQDQLEQCEEMVRNNLNGDNTAETDGIEAAEDDEVDDDDDDSDNDNLNRKIAQIAVNVFSHSQDKEGDSDHSLSHQASQEPDRAAADDDHGLPAAVAAGKESADATPSVNGKGQADDGKKEKKKSEKEEEEEEGEEYVVYEYEDVANGEDKEKGEEEEKEAGSAQHSDGAAPEPKKGNEDVSQNQDEETHATDTPTTTAPAQTQRSVSEMDTRDSDAEEPQLQPEEVSITTIDINDNNNNNNNNNNNKNISSDEEDSNSAVNRNAAVQQQQEQTTQDPGMILTTEDAVSAGHQESTTTRKNKPAASSEERTTATPAQPEEKSDPPLKDNNSEETRIKRSVLSLEPVLLTNVVEEEGGVQGNVQRVTFGKGRIRRQTSSFSRDEVKSWLLKHLGTVGQEPSVEVMGDMLRSVLVQLHGVNHLMVGQENSPVAQEPLEASPPHMPIANPTWKNSQAVMEVIKDTTDLEKQGGENAGDVIKTADSSFNNDVTKTAEENRALTHDAIKMAAEQFLEAHKTSSSSHLTIRGAKRVGLPEEEAELLQRLLAPSDSSRAERVRRRRRSVVGQGLSPERFVPLIDQLVERLNYLQHSVKVCHMLLPQGPLPGNHTVA